MWIGYGLSISNTYHNVTCFIVFICQSLPINLSKNKQMKVQEMVGEGRNESGPSFLEYGEENASQNGESIGNQSEYEQHKPKSRKVEKSPVQVVSF